MKAILTVDVDTLNDYAYTYSIRHHKYPDLIYEKALPRLLELLEKYRLRATFFVVGRDLEQKQHIPMVKLIAKRHEIANHSFSHRHDFEKLSAALQEEEIVKCHEIVKKKLKITMKGFRAPGYNINENSLKILSKLHYSYDSSIFPTSLLPILKLSIMLKSKGRHKSSGGGSIGSMFSKTGPYKDQLYNILEIPVSVTPLLRLPVMGTFNVTTGKSLLRLSLALLKKYKRVINYEIHPIEFLELDKDQIPKEFGVHPGLKINLRRKNKIYEYLFEHLKDNYTVVTAGEFAHKYK